MLKPLRIVSFWDGRPGHAKQTSGVLTALSKLTLTEVSSRTIQPPPLAGSLKKWLFYFGSCAGPNDQQSRENQVDLIIGTGASTHIPMLLYKKKCLAAKVVTCMMPDYPFKKKMDLCFIPQHDRPALQDNIFTTIGPPCSVAYSETHDMRKGLILVGGLDPKSHQWRSATVLQQIRSVLEKEPFLKWTISTSPRTPDETIEKITLLTAQTSGVDFFNSKQTPPGWIEDQYLKNDTVWVTADSISMVYEALTAGCRVAILPVSWRRKNNKFQRGLDYLIENKQVTPYDRWLHEGYFSAKRIRLDEASRCAKELLRRWWPNRLK